MRCGKQLSVLSVRGVDHWRSQVYVYCRLVEFCSLMYGANIALWLALKEPIAWNFIVGIYSAVIGLRTHSLEFHSGHIRRCDWFKNP